MESVEKVGNAHVLFFDGSYKKSHDAAFGGIALYDPHGKPICKKGFKVNEANYSTLEAGLRICLKHVVKSPCIRGDVLLVLNQVLGVWKRKNTSLKAMCFRIKGLLKKFEAQSVRHIEHNLNEEAHEAKA